MNVADSGSTTGTDLFDGYNARMMRPAEVAQTFIPPPAFDQLVNKNHAVLVGPRGSGKTTLLKMLEGEALEAWDHPDATKYRRAIDFTGVFVPTDVSWSEQIASLGRSTASGTPAALVSQAAFATHVLRSLVTAMNYRIHGTRREGFRYHRRLDIDRWTEVDLTEHIANAWELSVAVPNLVSLREALELRLGTIARLARQAESEGWTGSSFPRDTAHEWLYLGTLPSVSIAIDKFNTVADEPEGRWALLLDELELAPSRIVRDLLVALRSTDSRLIFKLAYSPFGTDLGVLERDTAASPTQDYTPIPLYYAHKDDGIHFTRTLVTSMLRSRGIEDSSVEDLLGRSLLDHDPSDRQADTPRRKSVNRMYAQLASRDASFSEYLASNSVDPRKLDAVVGTARASVIRKVVGLVPIRLTYREWPATSDQRRRRTRKNPPIYSGAPAMLAMLEGNPRWTIGVVSALLDEYQKKPGQPVGQEVQSRHIARASSRFLALLRTIATSPHSSVDDGRLVRAVRTSRVPSVYRLIDAIGNYFNRQVLADSFTPDPYGTFRVDPGVPEELELLLGRALNAGAILLVPDKGDAPMTARLTGRRFRLSYLLAPTYHLPLRLDRPISLSSILDRATLLMTVGSSRSALDHPPGQLPLPDLSSLQEPDVGDPQ